MFFKCHIYATYANYFLCTYETTINAEWIVTDLIGLTAFKAGIVYIPSGDFFLNNYF